MLPCFALLLTAAGVGLLLEEDAPRASCPATPTSGCWPAG
jgi:hypothetical protein